MASCLLGNLYGDIVIDGVLTHDYSVDIGTKSYGSITVSNKGDKSAGFKIYLNDFHDSGLSTFSGPPGSAPRSNANWITLESPEFVTLQPEESKKILYSVDVPRDNSLFGTYWCVAMVEPVTENIITTNKGFSITPVIRYAIRVIATIRGTGEAIIEIGDKKIVDSEEELLIKIAVNNKGSKVFKAPASFQMFSSTGEKIIDEKGRERRIFPDESIELVYTIPKETPQGEYQILLFLEGEDDILAAQYDLTVPGSEDKMETIKNQGK